MPALLSAQVAIELKAAKPHGLADLGVPLNDASVVKKGKLGEFAQTLDSGKPGRRFQNVKLTAVKTSEGGEVTSRIIVSFEAFGDDNVPATVNQGVSASLTAGGQPIHELALGTLFLPFACCWYENRFAAQVPNDIFDRADGLSLVARADEVRVV